MSLPKKDITLKATIIEALLKQTSNKKEEKKKEIKTTKTRN